MSISKNTMRVGRTYQLVNYGEVFKFKTLSIDNNDDFLIKTLDTLEICKLSELYEFGKGKDFKIDEIDE
ncbi:hypothetical protein [Flammeovirga kamogawensis]|uniref:Uncharacterized protein n=1 Tax=Flammeovirga kamogawensis TaxID=373891 RepID=A0ABX8GSA4_9BACT|nr:hypothetical protein [Flammeovirga kamogawensis]MBB6464082.1 hypothetical protein [Flammeovirga kamogawensis]QWG06132.1 hypothetical protein KM029_12320 [Flammeovirga kamogawensis]TRX67964.1 hypothetical protein EO216_07345 [Flammeovirga kamogawensis]